VAKDKVGSYWLWTNKEKGTKDYFRGWGVRSMEEAAFVTWPVVPKEVMAEFDGRTGAAISMLGALSAVFFLLIAASLVFWAWLSNGLLPSIADEWYVEWAPLPVAAILLGVLIGATVYRAQEVPFGYLH
jgi:hypothetical protein